jgi:uncharacterized protein
MKIFFISDIHGSAAWLDRALAICESVQADQIVLLGDLMYHGPRNPLPDGYNPGEVAALLNRYKHKIIAVRGNCDAEVDQLLIEFPMMADYAWIYNEGRRIFVTHGHLTSMEELPPLSPGDLFIQGHTHLPVAEQQGDFILLNPGSIALPKGGYPNSYAILEGTDFRICDFDGNVIKQIHLD